LALHPLPGETCYALHSAWAEAVGGSARRTRFQRLLGLRVAAAGERLHLTLRALAPPVQQPEPTAFEALALPLARLYAELVLAAAPTGEWQGLLNEEAIRQVWATIRGELLATYPASSQVVAELIAGTDQHLASPAGLGLSLPYDYAYAALLGNFYQQPFDTQHHYWQAKEFPNFFDALALHFAETLRLAPADDPAQVTLHLGGELDRAATDVAAIAAYVQATLGLPAAIDPAEVQATYQATHTLLRATGLPLAVKLTVRCTYREQYCKEYYLTISPQPAS